MKQEKCIYVALASAKYWEALVHCTNQIIKRLYDYR
jgi:hypothetical protein